MIGIVLVSHSKALALGIRDLVLQMTGPDFPIAVAAGVGEDFAEIGTDAVHVAEVLRPFCAGDGAVVLMDLGSAVLSAQTALELLEMEEVPGVENIRLCPAPIVEAAVAASVQAKTGGSLDAVMNEATAALAPKQSHLGEAPAAAPSAEPSSADGASLSFEIEILNPHGLHARPAANLVQAASRFSAEVRLTNLTGGRGPAPARSLTGVALLQARKGDRVRFDIRGADAEAALRGLRELAEARFGEPQTDAAPPPPAAMPQPHGTGGVPASDGIAVGPAMRLDALLPEAPDAPAGTPEEERRRLDAALRQVGEDLQAQAAADTTGIFAAQALILSDPELLAAVHARIGGGGAARAAWREETAKLADAYAAMEDPYLQARAADLRDIALRAGRALAGGGPAARIAPEPPAVLLVDELLPSEASACDPQRVLGILARAGSPTAHAAIIARTLGIPMVVGAAGLDFAALDGTTVALDGATGEVRTDPPPAAAADFAERRRAFLANRAAFAAAKDEPAVTQDGVRIAVLANAGSAADAAAARNGGAEGIGLLRSEFVYLPFSETPSEDRQAEALAEVFAAAGPGPVVVRTLDVGADKPLSFLHQAKEANPFLGVRGVRLSLRNPDFFASNLRAILRAGKDADLWVMVPMVAEPEEMIRARACLDAAHEALAAAGTPHRWPVEIGMMVEVPAAAMMLERFLPHADFFSIGTNDLTQYVLAAERGNAGLAAMQDALAPAVLRTVRMICDKAGDRHVAVCGDAASDPLAAAALIGAGVRTLSARPNQVAAIKAAVRGISAAEAGTRLEKALACDDAAAVRALFS
ncbi:MAG: phosphoenolpyruvate--protein phosphotransferase [Rhodospirillaceae bacterium]